jgi:hypothetical protein
MLEDKKLMELISSLGNQIEGYEYTKGTVKRGVDPERILESRKETLKKDLNSLISYVKKNY